MPNYQCNNTLCSARCLCALNEKWNNDKVKWTAPWNSSGTLFGTEKRTSDKSMLEIFHHTDNLYNSHITCFDFINH